MQVALKVGPASHCPLIRLAETDRSMVFLGCSCGWVPPQHGDLIIRRGRSFSHSVQEMDVEEAWIRHAAYMIAGGSTARIAPAEPGKARKPDTIRIVDRGDYARAGGDAICSTCECTYREHDEVRGFPGIHRACDGRLFKL